jgi:hypothetical protein
VEAQSRAFNSGAGVETFTTCWSLSAPEFRNEGGGTITCVSLPALRNQKGQAGISGSFLFPISFLKRNGDPSVVSEELPSRSAIGMLTKSKVIGKSALRS